MSGYDEDIPVSCGGVIEVDAFKNSPDDQEIFLDVREVDSPRGTYRAVVVMTPKEARTLRRALTRAIREAEA